MLYGDAGCKVLLLDNEVLPREEQITITTEDSERLVKDEKIEIKNQNCASRFMYNRSFFLVYFSVCLVTIFLFYWEIKYNGWVRNDMLPDWYIALDWGVITLLTLKVVLRFVASSSCRKFFRSKMNIFDIIVLIVCVTSQVLWFTLPNNFKEDTETTDLIMIGVRYGSRVLLICFGLANQRLHLNKIASAKEKVIFCVSGEYVTDSHQSMQVIDDPEEIQQSPTWLIQ